MEREQRVDALQVGARGEQHGRAAARRARLAAGEATSTTSSRTERRRRHGERYRATGVSSDGQEPLATVLATTAEIAAMLSLARRALSGLGVVLGVVTLMFVLLRLAPGDPALLLVGPAATAEQVAAQRHALGLDRPVAAQYAAWLGRFARGDWGTSIATGRPVRAMLGEAWPATVRLVGHLAGAELPARASRSAWCRPRAAAGSTPRSRWPR